MDYASLEEAVKDAGFPLTAPERIEGYDGPLVQLMSGKMLQLIFRSGDDRLIIRKAAGSEDISGNYGLIASARTDASTSSPERLNNLRVALASKLRADGFNVAEFIIL